jgi:hypothetical protein
MMHWHVPKVHCNDNGKGVNGPRSAAAMTIPSNGHSLFANVEQRYRFSTCPMALPCHCSSQAASQDNVAATVKILVENWETLLDDCTIVCMTTA